MKKHFTRWMIAAAALAAAAGSASAQTYNAEIPLSFHVGDKLMVPGSYKFRLSTTSSVGVIQIYNVDARTSALMLTGVRRDAPKAWREAGNPVITFECSAGDCAPSGLWTGADPFAYALPGLKLRRGEPRAEVVTVRLAKAD